MSRTLCCYEKTDRKENFEAYARKVRNPKYLCMDCGRAAGKEKWLCEAKKLKVKENEAAD